jgi:hypothetical protein
MLFLTFCDSVCTSRFWKYLMVCGINPDIPVNINLENYDKILGGKQFSCG